MSFSLDRLKAWPAKGQLNVTIVGAGNLAHVLVGMLGARPEVNVSMFTRKADKIAAGLKAGVRVKLQSLNNSIKDTFVTGKCVAVSSDAKDVIPSADFVIITVPSHARRWVMEKICPHMARDKKVFVGVMPGMGGFDWIASEVCAQHKIDNCVVWGLKDVPFMSAWTVPGKSSTNLGPKKDLYLALGYNKDKSEAEQAAETAVAKDIIQNLTNINTVVLSSFMVITLTPGNPIMHPSIMYGMFGPHSQWDGKPLKEKPLFYEAVSELSSFFLQKCDNEVQDIKNAIQDMAGVDLTPVWPLRLNLKKVYGERVGDNRTLMRAMQTNRAYETIRTPLKQVAGGFVPNIDHRFFLEDVPFGLCILHDVAEMVGVKTPMIDEILVWCQGLMNKEYLVDGRLNGKDMRETGCPRAYGVLNIFDLVRKTNLGAKL